MEQRTGIWSGQTQILNICPHSMYQYWAFKIMQSFTGYKNQFGENSYCREKMGSPGTCSMSKCSNVSYYHLHGVQKKRLLKGTKLFVLGFWKPYFWKDHHHSFIILLKFGPRDETTSAISISPIILYK